MSAVLQERSREHVVLERRNVGDRWRTERWDSLRFQFPNWSLELRAYAYSGDDSHGFAHWREILRVIQDYAASTRAPVRQHTEVTELRAREEAAATFAGFLSAAREFAAANPELELAEEEELTKPPIPPMTNTEMNPLELRRDKVAAIVWATGYDYDYGWLRAPVLDGLGRPLQ